MKMVGHKTEAIYRRYAIADESMLREGAVRLATFHESAAVTVQSKAARVVALDRKRSAAK